MTNGFLMLKYSHNERKEDGTMRNLLYNVKHKTEDNKYNKISQLTEKLCQIYREIRGIRNKEISHNNRIKLNERLNNEYKDKAYSIYDEICIEMDFARRLRPSNLTELERKFETASDVLNYILTEIYNAIFIMSKYPNANLKLYEHAVTQKLKAKK